MIEILYGELRDGALRVGRPLLRNKDVIKRDLLSTPVHRRISPNTDTRGGKVLRWGCRRRTLESRLHARERRGKNEQRLRAVPHCTSAPPVTKTATPRSRKILPKSPALTIATSRRSCNARQKLVYSSEKKVNLCRISAQIISNDLYVH